jgi:hypothetical protein
MKQLAIRSEAALAIRDRLGAIPGVRDVSSATYAPMPDNQ